MTLFADLSAPAPCPAMASVPDRLLQFLLTAYRHSSNPPTSAAAPAAVSAKLLGASASLAAIGVAYAVLAYALWAPHYRSVMFGHTSPLLHSCRILLPTTRDEKQKLQVREMGGGIGIKVYANGPSFIPATAGSHGGGWLARVHTAVVMVFALTTLVLTELCYGAWAVSYIQLLARELQSPFQQTGGASSGSLFAIREVRAELRWAACLLLWGMVLKHLHATAARWGMGLAAQSKKGLDDKDDVEARLDKVARRVSLVGVASSLACIGLFGVWVGVVVHARRNSQQEDQAMGGNSSGNGGLNSQDLQNAIWQLQKVFSVATIFVNLLLTFMERAGVFALFAGEFKKSGSASPTSVITSGQNQVLLPVLFESKDTEKSVHGGTTARFVASLQLGDKSVVNKHVYTCDSGEQLLIFHQARLTTDFESSSGAKAAAAIEHKVWVNMPYPTHLVGPTTGEEEQDVDVFQRVPALACLEFTTLAAEIQQDEDATWARAEAVVLELMGGQVPTLLQV